MSKTVIEWKPKDNEKERNRYRSRRITGRFAASGAITRIKSNAARVNLSLVSRELTAPPDGKPHNTLNETRDRTLKDTERQQKIF
jgi:hypothetical protein